MKGTKGGFGELAMRAADLVQYIERRLKPELYDASKDIKEILEDLYK